MSNLIINDLVESTEMDSKAMARVHGGDAGLFTLLLSRVNDNDALSAQTFNVGTVQTGTNGNFQDIFVGNGINYSPVYQTIDQDVYVKGGDTTAGSSN